MRENMDAMIDHVLLDEESIRVRIAEMGREITEDYKDDDHDLVMVCILKGAIMFMTELFKHVDVDAEIDFMSVSSYGDSTTSSGDVRILKDLDQNIVGKNILIIEDIIDTGYTLSYLKDNLESRGANSVKIASLLNKEDRRVTEIHGDYVGFEIPDEFVVGYGLDYKQKLRNLPYVGTLKPEVYMTPAEEN